MSIGTTLCQIGERALENLKNIIPNVKKNNFIEKPGFVVLLTWKRYHLRAPIREMVGSGKKRWIRARFTLKYPFALYSGFEEKV